MEADKYLRRFSEQQPHWISQYASGATVDGPTALSALLSSRTVFYPGSGSDGSPVSLFNRAQAVHCFVYCDNGLSRGDLKSALSSYPFDGYEAVTEIELTDQDLEAAGCAPPNKPGFQTGEPAEPYAIVVIFQRKAGLDETHGAAAFSVLFMGWDGFHAFDSLFCQRKNSAPPFGIVLQDHGFGGSSGKFGAGGQLEKMAKENGKMPELVLIAENTSCWAGYAEPTETDGSASRLGDWPGGMHGHSRRLGIRRA